MRPKSLRSWAVLYLMGSATLVAGIAQGQASGISSSFILFPPTRPAPAVQEPEHLARQYLLEKAASLSLSNDLSELELVTRRTSLLATHFTFQQKISGRPIEGATITLSVMSDGRIANVSTRIFRASSLRIASTARISSLSAYDAIWNWLGAQGEILAKPDAQLVYRSDKDSLKLAYRIRLATSKPYGYWLAYVDAESGKILEIRDESIKRKPDTGYDPRAPSLQIAGDRPKAFQAFQAKHKSPNLKTLQSFTSGQAQVFDPDPRTSLQRTDLEDSSPADQFASAYYRRFLPEISLDANLYRLEGPWVRIVDFDPPHIAPIPSTDGIWLFERGLQGFNDAMTYFHIDQNQRYLQSLGYLGPRAIQNVSIEADAHGVSEEDNSHFLPSTNQISFGHGCVDDNEDADVILHEYFHAISYGINPSSLGSLAERDAGAMIEGFADYWAASYSHSTPNGPVYKPNDVYSWDGHSQTGQCWRGRVLNASKARYDRTREYPAHSPANDGYSADELWSTPLFQSFLKLRSLGIPREQIDTIIVESLYGIGSAPKMPEVAQLIIATAQALYPDGPHAAAFKQEFRKHGMLDQAELQLKISEIADSGNNGIFDPGETLNFQVQVSNIGTLAAEQVQVELKSDDPNIGILQANSSVDDIAVGTQGRNNQTLQLQIKSSAICGDMVKFRFLVRALDTEEAPFLIELRLGQAQEINYRIEPKLKIPDNSIGGLHTLISVDAIASVSDQFRIGVNIRHPYRGDLRATLISPQGTSVLLQDRSGFSADNLSGIYPTTLIPKEPLNKLYGQNIQGVWELWIQDLGPTDTGTLEEWSLQDTMGYVCQ